MRIILTEETQLEILQLLNKVTSAGMFAIHKAHRTSLVPLNTKAFKYREALKERQVVISEEDDGWADKYFLEKDAPRPLRLLKIVTFDQPTSTTATFYENDVFHFYKKSVRIEMSKRTFDGKFELLRIFLLATKPHYSERSLLFFSQTENARMEFLLSQPLC